MRGKQDYSRERELRRNQTEAERHLWRFLRNQRLLGFKFRRQHRIGPFFADFVCAEYGLVVELDGSQHLDTAEADARRTRVLGRMGYRVVRVWNDDVLVRTGLVLDVILMALREAPLRDVPSPCAAARRCPSPRKRGEG
ncbi:endonuclease domain-containing protein [Lysobacter terrae]